MKSFQCLKDLSTQDKVLDGPQQSSSARWINFGVLGFATVLALSLFWNLFTKDSSWVPIWIIALLFVGCISMLPHVVVECLDNINPILAMELCLGTTAERYSGWVTRKNLASAMPSPNSVLICVPLWWGKAWIIDPTGSSPWPLEWNNRLMVRRPGSQGLMFARYSIEDGRGNVLLMSEKELLKEIGHVRTDGTSTNHRTNLERNRAKIQSLQSELELKEELLALCKASLQTSVDIGLVTELNAQWVSRCTEMLRAIKDSPRFNTNFGSRRITIMLMQAMCPYVSHDLRREYTGEIARLVAKVGNPSVKPEIPAA